MRTVLFSVLHKGSFFQPVKPDTCPVLVKLSHPNQGKWDWFYSLFRHWSFSYQIPDFLKLGSMNKCPCLDSREIHQHLKTEYDTAYVYTFLYTGFHSSLKGPQLKNVKKHCFRPTPSMAKSLNYKTPAIFRYKFSHLMSSIQRKYLGNVAWLTVLTPQHPVYF